MYVCVYYQVDLGTGNNNKINWAMGHKQEMLDIIEVHIQKSQLPVLMYKLDWAAE